MTLAVFEVLRIPHTAGIYLNHTRLPLHRNHPLLERFEQRLGVGNTGDDQHRRCRMFGENGNRADTEDAGHEGLVEAEVFDVPEFQRVDVAAQKAALKVNAVVGDAEAISLGAQPWNGQEQQADDDHREVEGRGHPFIVVDADDNRQRDEDDACDEPQKAFE
jgi:hypothetical protein